MSYDAFLANKKTITQSAGIAEPYKIGPMLFDFQADIVRWALKRGRACIFADCGLGKTIMQLTWADNIPGDVLILAPLAVTAQTVEEGERFGINVRYCRDMDEVDSGITITNYEMLKNFDTSFFSGVVLDESSILKSYTGKFRNHIIDSFRETHYKLACTATPAPNDFMELGNHSEFVGTMSRTEMLSMFFVHDGGETQKWRLKGHADEPFWKWICSWAVNIRKPSDLGYDDGAFTLPEMTIHHHVVKKETPPEGFLFHVEALTLQERSRERSATVTERVAMLKSIDPGDRPFLVWCNLNTESAEATNMIGAVEIKGSDDVEHKKKAMLGFSHGDIRAIVTKPSIAGFGMNWQHCSDVAFIGLSDSYEQFYQAVRRCWRFGQKRNVNVHVITAETEGAVVKNIQRKEVESEKLSSSMVKFMADITSEEIKSTVRSETKYIASERIQIPYFMES